jgi:hypothetical protein
MGMLTFNTFFPELAIEEMRVLHIKGMGIVPDGEYGLLEFYCDELDCDCRRVIINIVSQKSGKFLASISYGWESIEFYENWTGNRKDAREAMGPYLDPLNEQSDYAPVFFRLFIKHVLPDSTYVERLKRHYNLFKSALAKKQSLLKLVKQKRKSKRWRLK